MIQYIRYLVIPLLIITPVIGLSCYAFDHYSETVRTVHHRTFCTAVFHVAVGTGAFNGSDRHPSQVATIVNMTKGEDCVLKVRF
ncbi:Protein CBG08934 [Caenorhabditis briggsae]|uniref:Protein CBG08934 n=1 Tax=Caenorhabditis briggsae TaxID=6238 RepID=A8X7Q6_CAEBR|nr:Protein CBG08934 [Caenorhabditis briggsae]CAP28667.1 Protein CBG08934 [Caenorhabditis briggsae]